jgi:hypothetical protein
MFPFGLDASTRVGGSCARHVVDVAEQQWRNAHPSEPVAHRHVVVDPITATASESAVFFLPVSNDPQSTPDWIRLDLDHTKFALTRAHHIRR